MVQKAGARPVFQLYLTQCAYIFPFGYSSLSLVGSTTSNGQSEAMLPLTDELSGDSDRQMEVQWRAIIRYGLRFCVSVLHSQSV